MQTLTLKIRYLLVSKVKSARWAWFLPSIASRPRHLWRIVWKPDWTRVSGDYRLTGALNGNREWRLRRRKARTDRRGDSSVFVSRPSVTLSISRRFLFSFEVIDGAFAEWQEAKTGGIRYRYATTNHYN